MSQNFEHSLHVVQCNLRHYETEGGTCLTGLSDIYVHCATVAEPTVGAWSEWAEETYCADRGYSVRVTFIRLLHE